MVSNGAFKGRLVSQLSIEELRKLTASRAQTPQMKHCIAVAKLRLTVGGLIGAEPRPTMPQPAVPPVCTVLAIPQQQTRLALPQQFHIINDVPHISLNNWLMHNPFLATKNLTWYIAKNLFLCTLLVMAYPPLAAVPAYFLGWICRLVARQFAEVVRTFTGTFREVVGDLFTEAYTSVTSTLPDVPGMNLGGSLLAVLAFFIMRKTP